MSLLLVVTFAALVIAVVMTVVGALLLATILCYAIERPALRALRSWYGRRRDRISTRARAVVE